MTVCLFCVCVSVSPPVCLPVCLPRCLPRCLFVSLILSLAYLFMLSITTIYFCCCRKHIAGYCIWPQWNIEDANIKNGICLMPTFKNPITAETCQCGLKSDSGQNRIMGGNETTVGFQSSPSISKESFVTRFQKNNFPLNSKRIISPSI